MFGENYLANVGGNTSQGQKNNKVKIIIIYILMLCVTEPKQSHYLVRLFDSVLFYFVVRIRYLCCLGWPGTQ